MILAIILRDRSGSSCLNGRRRTRDWSGRRIVDVRWTRIEEVVIMDWLIRKPSPEGRNYFQREVSSESCPGRLGVVTIPTTALRSPTGGTSMASPALVDVGSIS